MNVIQYHIINIKAYLYIQTNTINCPSSDLSQQHLNQQYPPPLISYGPGVMSSSGGVRFVTTYPKPSQQKFRTFELAGDA